MQRTITQFLTGNVFLLLLSLTTLLQQASAQTVLTGLASNGGPDGKGTLFNINTNGSGFSITQSFADWGQLPNGSLLKGDDGNFYGMTSNGGTYGYGSIFKMSATGAVTVLKEFNYSTDGGYPDGELIRGADGLYYGMTVNGGVNGYGTIFKISSSGVFTIVRSLSYADGGNPRGHLTLASDGNYYGITYGGGANGYGAIFKLTPNGSYTVIHSMNNTTDGGNSYSSLTEGKDGNLYGVTSTDATNYAGTIFKVTKSGALTVLRFLKTADGTTPKCDLIQATDGNFYGTCNRGGANGVGTLFKITPSGTYTVVRNFSYTADGGYPNGSLMQNSDGLLYGMTTSGGANGVGIIFKLSLSGTYTVLHSLNATTEGSYPNGALVKGNDASLYALASSGGVYNMGTAFKVTTGGAVTRLANMNGATLGNAPLGSPIKGKDSAYYFTTSTGGAYGYGSIVKICGGTPTVLFSFNKFVNGATPKGNLVQATDGNFYGTTYDGGTNGGGTIFKITPAGNLTVLRHLSGSKDGYNPSGSLIQASDGFLYGMCTNGGPNLGGTIFKINTSGTSYTVIRSFVNATDGSNPQGSLIQAKDGNLYGMTTNVAKIFKLTLSGAFTVIHTFNSSTEGYYPLGSLIQGKDGNLYGTCSDGGSKAAGTIFQVSTSGALKVLRTLDVTKDGRMPKGTLMQGPDGILYGTTSVGGTYNNGTVFKVTTGGTYTVLRHLNLTKDGGTPLGGLIFAPVNNLVANSQSVTTNQDKAVAITLTGSGATTFNYVISTQPKNGTLSGSGANRTYTPNPGYFGADSFGFKTSVGCMASAPAKVKITVKAVNHAPVLDSIPNKTVVQNNTLKFTATAKDQDATQTLKFSLTSAPAGATINATSGAFSWTPATTGSYKATIRVTDNGSPAMYDEQTITIKVTAATTIAANSNATLSATALKSDGQLFNARLYPNPVHTTCNLQLNTAAETITVTIADAKGSVVMNKQLHLQGTSSASLDVAALSSGMYFLTVQSANNRQTIKFIKQ